MDIFELDQQAVQVLQGQGFNLLERANLIYAVNFFPDCDNPPTLNWVELTTGVNLLLGDYEGREFEVIIKFSFYPNLKHFLGRPRLIYP